MLKNIYGRLSIVVLEGQGEFLGKDNSVIPGLPYVYLHLIKKGCIDAYSR